MHAATHDTPPRRDAPGICHNSGKPNSDPIKVKGIPPRPVDFCSECGHPYYPRLEAQEFCGTPCRNKFHKRRQKRGTELYDFAMRWRGKRLKGGFTALCQMVDDWLRDDKARRQEHRAIRDAFKKQQREQGTL